MSLHTYTHRLGRAMWSDSPLLIYCKVTLIPQVQFPLQPVCSQPDTRPSAMHLKTVQRKLVWRSGKGSKKVKQLQMIKGMLEKKMRMRRCEEGGRKIREVWCTTGVLRCKRGWEKDGRKYMEGKKEGRVRLVPERKCGKKGAKQDRRKDVGDQVHTLRWREEGKQDSKEVKKEEGKAD